MEIENSISGEAARHWSLGPLKYKADWPEARRRWEAFWDGEALDRPIMAIRGMRGQGRQAGGGTRAGTALPRSATGHEALYFDPETIAASMMRWFETMFFAGEAVPCTKHLDGNLALGWPSVQFAPDALWVPKLMQSIEEPLPWRPGPQDRWRENMASVLRRLLAMAEGKFLVGCTIQSSANDLLTLMRGTQELLLDLVENPAQCRQQLAGMLPRWVENFDYFRSIVQEKQVGYVYGWPGLWSRRPVLLVQSDMSCMISREMFAEFVLPEMDYMGERYPLWYHLDGSGAIRHLPALLSRPYIRVVQYVPEHPNKPNGPLFIDMYREIQKAGRGVDIEVPEEHIEYVVRHLRPGKLILRSWINDEERAQELIGKAGKWAGTDLGLQR